MSDNVMTVLEDCALGQIPAAVLEDPDPGGAAVRRLGRALMAAAYRIEQEMLHGVGSLQDPHGRSTAHQLLGKIERLLELMQKNPPPSNPEFRFIPSCPVCGEKAGQHWAHDCPKLDRFGRDCTWDYKKNERIFYEQIHPLAEPLKPHPRDRFTCVVCRSQWVGKFADQLIEEGDTFGEAERDRLFKLIKERGLG